MMRTSPHTCICKAASSLWLAALLGIASAPAAWAANITKTPPPNFKKASSLVQLPDFVPGLGTLYVDPSTLPMGPFLGYNHRGKLVDIVYMVPVKDFEAHRSFENLGGLAAGLKINHTDIQYNPGHPGLEEPHYHIVQWLISPDTVKIEMK